MNDQQKENIRRLRTEGHSYTKIADLLGVSENTVKSYCRRNDLAGVATVLFEPRDCAFCRQCGAPVKQTAGKKQKKFCSDKCRMTWWNAHPEAVNHRSIRTFICQTCGRNFHSYGERERKYCSHTCCGKSKAVRT